MQDGAPAEGEVSGVCVMSRLAHGQILIGGTRQSMEPISSSAARAQTPFVEASGRNEAHSSAVTWGAVVAGAFAAAALSLALLALSAGDRFLGRVAMGEY
jgi:hypothetical protein